VARTAAEQSARKQARHQRRHGNDNDGGAAAAQRAAVMAAQVDAFHDDDDDDAEDRFDDDDGVDDGGDTATEANVIAAAVADALVSHPPLRSQWQGNQMGDAAEEEGVWQRSLAADKEVALLQAHIDSKKKVKKHKKSKAQTAAERDMTPAQVKKAAVQVRTLLLITFPYLCFKHSLDILLSSRNVKKAAVQVRRQLFPFFVARVDALCAAVSNYIVFASKHSHFIQRFIFSFFPFRRTRDAKQSCLLC
jgi:hypothetical protein